MLIVCNINMFTMEQIVRIGDEVYKVPMNKLGTSLAEMFAQNNNVEEIQLYGPEAFLAEIASEIQTCYSLNYSVNPHTLKIGVNNYDLSC